MDGPSNGATDAGMGIVWSSPAPSALRVGAESIIAEARDRTGIVVQAATGVIVAANPRAADILGMTWDQLVGRTSADPRWSAVSEFGLPLVADEHPAMVALRTGRPVSGFVMGVQLSHPPVAGHVTGAPTRWIEIDSQPVLADDGASLGVVTLFADITSTKRGHEATERLLGAFRLLVDNGTDVVWEGTNDGTIVWISSSVTDVLGRTPGSLAGRPFVDLVHPDDRAEVQRVGQELLAGELARMTIRVRRSDGTWTWVWIMARPVLDATGAVVGRVGGWRVVDAEIRAQEALAESEGRYRTLADLANDVVWTMAPDGRITYISPAIERVRGLTVAEAMAQPLDQIHPPDSAAVSAGYFRELLEDVAAGRAPRSFRGELEYYRKDGSTFWTEVIAQPVVTADGRLIEVIGVTRDLTERKAQEDELRRARDAAQEANAALRVANAELHLLATTDVLTGAWNRRHFEQEAQREIALARRHGQPLSLVLLDLDRFKAINDVHGHLAGDEALVQVARRVQARLRVSDRLARWGGEEFVILLPQTELAEAAQVAESVRAVIVDHPLEEVGTVTVSCGVAQLAPDETLDDWFRRVDDALYRAKEAGRNRVVAAGAD